MAFSQYFLIWYGNIPEETVWFLHRWDGNWKIISLILVFGHFVIPFFVLFPMEIKKNIPVMLGIHLSWMDLTTVLGIGGIFIWRFLRITYSRPLVPVNDPRLETSIKIIS
jgi:hypothetical protein